MKVLGIDPGYGRCGVAVVERGVGGRGKIIISSCITTNSTTSFENRLLAVVSEVSFLLKEYKPDICALERLYFTNNQKTAMHVAEARGAIIAAVSGYGVAVREFGPGEIKVAITGSGKSTKKQVIRMVSLLTDMQKDKAFDDEFDAIAVALTALAVLRE